MKYIYVIAAIIIVFGCKKKDDVPDYASQVAGKYKGILTAEASGTIEGWTDTGYVINISKINDNTVTIYESSLSISQQATLSASISGDKQDTICAFNGAAMNPQSFYVRNMSGSHYVDQLSISFTEIYNANEPSIVYYFQGTKQ